MENKITKAELIKEVTEIMKESGAKISQDLTKDTIDTFLDVIGAHLQKKDTVKLSGFATFEVKEVKASTKRNPKTGESVDVPEHGAIRVKLSNTLKSLVR